MAKAKRSGKSYTGGYANYKLIGKETKNRLIKLTKLAKEQPNNEQIISAMKDIHRRRHTPKVPTWSHQAIAVAKVVKQFTGTFSKDWFSADPKIFAAAAATRNENKFIQAKVNTAKQKNSLFGMFSVMARAHDGQGNLVWK